jgi:hypothetical protein
MKNIENAVIIALVAGALFLIPIMWHQYKIDKDYNKRIERIDNIINGQAVAR